MLGSVLRLRATKSASQKKFFRFAHIRWFAPVIAALLANEAFSDMYVVPDLSIHWGAWEGWGISLAWWAKAYGERDDLADLMFSHGSIDWQGRPTPCLGLNIVRYNAGASGVGVVTFSKCEGPVTRWTTQFGPGDRYTERKDLRLEKSVLVCPLAAQSVQTMEIEGVSR